jgi:hypothetical protein
MLARYSILEHNLVLRPLAAAIFGTKLASSDDVRNLGAIADNVAFLRLAASDPWLE